MPRFMLHPPTLVRMTIWRWNPNARRPRRRFESGEIPGCCVPEHAPAGNGKDVGNTGNSGSVELSESARDRSCATPPLTMVKMGCWCVTRPTPRARPTSDRLGIPCEAIRGSRLSASVPGTVRNVLDDSDVVAHRVERQAVGEAPRNPEEAART